MATAVTSTTFGAARRQSGHNIFPRHRDSGPWGDRWGDSVKISAGNCGITFLDTVGFSDTVGRDSLKAVINLGPTIKVDFIIVLSVSGRAVGVAFSILVCAEQSTIAPAYVSSWWHLAAPVEVFAG